MFRHVLRDARIAVRLLWAARTFTTIAALTLALGIGATTTIFSVIYTTFLEPLPYRDADRLVMVWSQQLGERVPASPGEFVEWRRHATGFEDLNSWSWWIAAVSMADTVEQRQVAPTTPGFLPMLGYGHPLALGRDFLQSEETPGNEHVVIITHRIWRERFASNPNVIGDHIRIDRRPYTIVGVLAAGPADENQSQLWVPLAFSREDFSTGLHRLLVMGRLKRGVSIAQAQANLAAVTRNASLPGHRSADGLDVTVQPFRNSFLSADTTRGLWLLLAGVVFILLIACANVANLMLARGTARQRELAIRTAIGALRSQIIAQMMVESMVLALLGGVVGTAFASGSLKIVMALLPPDMLPTEAHVRLNVPVLVFTLAACGAVGILCGAAPAWQAGRTNVNELLKDAARSVSGTGHRLQRALVVLEFALAITLLTGGALAMQTLFGLVTRDLGFRKDHLLTFTLPIGDDRFSGSEEITEFYRRILEPLQTLPAVTAASVSVDIPLQGGIRIPFSVVGKPEAEPSQQPFAGFNMVTPSYFETFGIPIIRGRGFSDRDRAGAARVAIINETLARRFLGQVDPLTQRLVMPQLVPGKSLPGPPLEWQIVGIRADIRDSDPVNDIAPAIEVPFWQSPWPFGRVTVRTRGEPTLVRQDIAAAIRIIDPDLPMGDVKTIEQLFSQSLVDNRFKAALFGSFAVIALLLAGLGIYGVMSFVVAQRRPEIGLRMALGAHRAQILRRIVGEGMITVGFGAALGSMGAFYAATAMRSVIPGLTRLDPGIFIVVTATLFAAALIACIVPAVRAASVDPLVALRRE